jgi:signal transduction histidine kinase
MFAMVVGALLFAGLATLGLTSLDSVHQTQTELASDATKLAQGVQKAVASGRHHESITVLRQSLSVLQAPLGLQGEAILAASSSGGDRGCREFDLGVGADVQGLCLYNLLSPGDPLPSGLTVDQLDIGDLLNSLPVTGHRGRLAYAAYLFSTQVEVANVANLVVVLTREAPSGVGDAGVWFAIAAAATLAVALIVADRLGHRLARPLQQAETVTRRIATGDLEARVPVPANVGHELVSLATSVNQMAASLARAQGTQRQFLMSVSHDLRTPLTSIRGFAEALYDGATTDVHYASGIIVSEAGRLERLVTDLLELAKLEAGAFSLHCRALDLSEVVSDTAQAFAPAASALGLAVQISTAPPASVTCDADRDRLGQVVANLVENALKFAASKVAVSTGLSGGGPWVAVEDDGPGIPEADLPRVFERLYQSRSTEGRKLGSGLGLAIVDELVVAMGGRVAVQSPTGPQGGTRVVATLKPVAPEAADGNGKPAKPA